MENGQVALSPDEIILICAFIFLSNPILIDQLASTS